MVQSLWQWHRPLAAMAAAMAAVLMVSVAGLVVDGRHLDGMPVWAKPGKFALSFVLFSLTWAVLFAYQRRARRLFWWAGTVIVVAGALEMVWVVGQAVRGQRSHFNETTVLDSLLFALAGAVIVVLFLVSLVLGVLVFRERYGEPALTWGVRLGVAMSLVGIAAGGLMVAAIPGTELGAGNTVGAPHGGPGLPLLGWSTVGGDLRVPHFLGMHALQAIPLLALLFIALARYLPALDDSGTRLRLVVVGAGAYTGLFALVTWQALRGEPLVHPGGETLTALAVLLSAAVAAGAVAVLRRVPTVGQPGADQRGREVERVGRG
jgi:hypothetical protein